MSDDKIYCEECGGKFDQHSGDCSIGKSETSNEALKSVVVIDSGDNKEFEDRCSFLIDNGYEMRSSNCSVMNTAEMEFASVWQAIFVMKEEAS